MGSVKASTAKTIEHFSFREIFRSMDDYIAPFFGKLGRNYIGILSLSLSLLFVWKPLF